MSQTEYKEIEDITEQVREMIQRINGYVPQIQIVKAKLILDTDGRGSYAYYIHLKYTVDDVEYKVTKQIYANLTETLRDLLFSIVDFYERMHVIKK